MLRFLTLVPLVPLVLLGLTGCAAPNDGSEAAAQCQRLRGLYASRAMRVDIYNQYGRLENDIGVDLCRRGRFADGAAELTRAVELLNLNLDPR
ncbi:hypothetical protein [Desertibaculum subflavum]|uniref:hypothetical protein n=1 Tax=Desertibaculum subflavum TaxID=2268458 RepID=UPI0013C4BD21